MYNYTLKASRPQSAMLGFEEWIGCSRRRRCGLLVGLLIHAGPCGGLARLDLYGAVREVVSEQMTPWDVGARGSAWALPGPQRGAAGSQCNNDRAAAAEGRGNTALFGGTRMTFVVWESVLGVGSRVRVEGW
jgi:hypothetical protein